MYLQRLSSFVTQVNSVHTVYTNIYKIFLLQAYRWVPWPHSHMWVHGTAEAPALPRPRRAPCPPVSQVFSRGHCSFVCVRVCAPCVVPRQRWEATMAWGVPTPVL